MSLMLIVAVAWVYVVGLMALTEPSIVAGIMTFLCYCVLPLFLLSYLTGAWRPRGGCRKTRISERTGSDNSEPPPPSY